MNCKKATLGGRFLEVPLNGDNLVSGCPLERLLLGLDWVYSAARVPLSNSNFGFGWLLCLPLPDLCSIELYEAMSDLGHP